MNKYRSAALALATCAASLAVAACSAGTPAASSASTSTAAPNQSVSTAAPPSTGAPIPGRSIAVSAKLASFPVPAAAKVVENMAGGQALVVVFGLIDPADVARFYATALPQDGYTVTTNSMLNKGGDSGAYIVFTGHGYKGTVDSLAQFPGTSVSGIGDKNVTTIIFAPSK
jgi:ABC-type phosphate transport system substrate-binding protein